MSLGSLRKSFSQFFCTNPRGKTIDGKHNDTLHDWYGTIFLTEIQEG